MYKKVVVMAAVAAVKTQPEIHAELADELLYGMEAELHEDCGAWVYLQSFYGYKGYVQKSDLTTAGIRGSLMIVNNTAADVLSEPEVESECLMTLTRGCIVDVAGEGEGTGRGVVNPDWVRIVCLGTGKTGYIRRAFLSPYTKPEWDRAVLHKGNSRATIALRRAIIDSAMMYIGTQYRWGGKTPLGIDCSGLCSMAYMLNGIIIYRDAKIVDGYAIKKIPAEYIRPGDLIYTKGHVSMYIQNDKILHSSVKGNGVKITDIDVIGEPYAIGSAFSKG